MIFDVKKVRFYRVDLKGTEAGWLPASERRDGSYWKVKVGPIVD
jgi:hypothetical protein